MVGYVCFTYLSRWFRWFGRHIRLNGAAKLVTTQKEKS